MYVQEIIVDFTKRKYLLINDEGLPVIPVVKYLKYLDNLGKSSNTQRTYCYGLKHFFEFLEQIKKEYLEITIVDLSNFVGYLRNPNGFSNIVPLFPVSAKRKETSINLMISAVCNFYDYLYRTEETENDIVEKLVRKICPKGNRVYKDFLFHVNSDKPINTNILKVKEPRKKVRYLTRDEVKLLYDATTNIRDKLLIKLLFETGIRIGEALSLFVEDFVIDYVKGSKIVLTNRGELINGAKLKTGERDVFISTELCNLFDDYIYEIIDSLNIRNNFLFVKLKGLNKGNPMTYTDVNALFKLLRKKTNIKIYPHLLRHSFASTYYRATKDIKQVQEALGHAQIQTAINFYVHLNDEDIRESWENARDSFKFE